MNKKIIGLLLVGSLIFTSCSSTVSKSKENELLSDEKALGKM